MSIFEISGKAMLIALLAGCGTATSYYSEYVALQERYAELEQSYLQAKEELAIAKQDIRNEREAIRDIYTID